MIRRTFVDGTARLSVSHAQEKSAARGTAADVPASSPRATFITSAMLTDASERILGSARAPKSPVQQHAVNRDRPSARADKHDNQIKSTVQRGQISALISIDHKFNYISPVKVSLRRNFHTYLFFHECKVQVSKPYLAKFHVDI